MKKPYLLVALTFLVGLIAIPAFAYGPTLHNPYATENGIPLTVHVDGRYVSTDVDPYTVSGRTYLPLRAATESMGASVNWNPYTHSATIKKDSTIIHCSVGSKAMTVNGVTRYNDAAPQVQNGRTMLPIRPIAEALGSTLDYDSYTASVYIDTPAIDAPAPTIPDNVPNSVRWLVEKYYVPTTDPMDYSKGGSWQAYKRDHYRIPALRYNFNYLFISPMADGTLNAVMVGLSNEGGMENVGVDSMQVSTSPFTYTLKDTWTPHYWNGCGIGGGPGFFNVCYNFDYPVGDLILSKADFYFQPGQLMDSRYTYQPFTRF